MTTAILFIIATACAPYAHTWQHHDFCQTLHAIIMVESDDCRYTHGVDPLAYGCAQIHVATAEKATGFTISPRVLSQNLTLNIESAAMYLHQCAKRYKTWAASVSCYHTGPAHPIDRRYTTAVMEAE